MLFRVESTIRSNTSKKCTRTELPFTLFCITFLKDKDMMGGKTEQYTVRWKRNWILKVVILMRNQVYFLFDGNFTYYKTFIRRTRQTLSRWTIVIMELVPRGGDIWDQKNRHFTLVIIIVEVSRLHSLFTLLSILYEFCYRPCKIYELFLITYNSW